MRLIAAVALALRADWETAEEMLQKLVSRKRTESISMLRSKSLSYLSALPTTCGITTP